MHKINRDFKLEPDLWNAIIIIGSTMSAENSRDYVVDYSSDSSLGEMQSVHNSGDENGASEGAIMDTESSSHGE